MNLALSADDAKKYINAITSFRLNDLQACLAETQYSQYGRKNELVDRLINLIRHPNPQVNLLVKIASIAVTVYGNQDLAIGAYNRLVATNPSSLSNGQISMTIGAPNNGITRYAQSMQVNARNRNPAIIPSLPAHRQPINDNVQRVKIVELPNFKILRELVKTELLDPRDRNIKRVDSKTYECDLPPDLTAEIFAYKSNPACQSSMKLPRTEIMLRIFKNDSSEIQVDDYPNECKVKVGRVQCTLPPLGQPSRVGQTPKRQNRHCDITYTVCEAVSQLGNKWKNNLPTRLVFTVEWENDPNLFYLIQVTVVRHVTADYLLNEFLLRPQLPTSNIRDRVIAHLRGLKDGDDEVQTEQSIPIQLKCPMTFAPIVYPARGDLCDHFTFFDMKIWLDSNEKRLTSKCPLCGKRVNFSKVQREQYYSDMLSVCPPEAAQAKLLPGGNWIVYDDNEKRLCASNMDGSVDGMVKMSSAPTAVIESPIKVESTVNGNKRPVDDAPIVLLSDDDDDENSSSGPPPAKQANMVNNDIIVLADDDAHRASTSVAPAGAAPVVNGSAMTSVKVAQPVGSYLQSPATQPQAPMLKWKTKMLDNGKKIMELDGRMPTAQVIKMVLDSPEFLAIPMVKHIVARCPKEHLYRVLYAYAQVLSVADQVDPQSGRDHAYVNWPGKMDIYRDATFPKFPLQNANKSDAPYYSELCVAYVGNITQFNSLEVFVSASAQAKEYPDIVMVIVHPNYSNCGYVTKLDKLAQDPPLWVTSNLKKRIEAEKRSAQQAKTQKQQQQQQANPFRNAHQAQQQATAMRPNNAVVMPNQNFFTTAGYQMPQGIVYTATMANQAGQQQQPYWTL